MAYTDHYHEAFERLIYPLLSKNRYRLKQRDYDLELSHFRVVRQETFGDIESKYVLNHNKIHHIHFRFLTSTSCKTQGGYAVFPFPYLILKNLVSKWNVYTDSSLIDSDRTADQLDEEMQVVDYHLHMHLSRWKAGESGLSGEMCLMAFSGMIWLPDSQRCWRTLQPMQGQA